MCGRAGEGNKAHAKEEEYRKADDEMEGVTRRTRAIRAYGRTLSLMLRRLERDRLRHESEPGRLLTAAHMPLSQSERRLEPGRLLTATRVARQARPAWRDCCGVSVYVAAALTFKHQPPLSRSSTTRRCYSRA